MIETIRYTFAAVAVAGTFAVPASALAGPRLEVRKGDCKTGVSLVAREVRLSEALGKLSKALDFQYRFEGERDPMLDVEIARQPVDLVKALARDQNLTLIQARDHECPGRDRIVRVWVLPQGKDGAPRPAPASAPVISPEAQKAYEDYLAAHGMRLGPDGREETIPAPK